VVNKPAGIATMGVPAGQSSLVQMAKDYIKVKYEKPGNVYLGVVSRLDRSVTGLVPLARTSKAAARLTEQFRLRQVEKSYLALVPLTECAGVGRLRHWLVKDEQQHRSEVVDPGHPRAQLAELEYRALRSDGTWTLLEVRLLTGRRHQIRAQLSAAGLPIAGDRRYGSHQMFSRGIALHARRLEFVHPVRHHVLRFVSEPPDYWPLRLSSDEAIE
jgi:23S rRNA pseudouridine1911/1915/1917 synthase